MRQILAAVAAAVAFSAVEAESVKVSDFGYDPEDSTRFIQQALDSGARTVVLDRQKGPWNTLTVYLRSNTEFVVEPGVELVAKRGAFKGQRDYLFVVDGVTNATIRGGAGSAFRMWKQDYQGPDYVRSEWRYALRITRSAHILVEGLRLCDSGGDGIGVAGTDITIRKCVCDNNHRQGISVFNVDGLLIEDTVLSNTKGTPPEAGIDFEPDTDGSRLSNVVMRNCLFENNTGTGIELYLVQLQDSTRPVSMRFENCRTVGNRNSMSLNPGPRAGRHVRGKVEFVGCSFESPRNSGLCVNNKTTDAFDVSFSGCTVSNVPKTSVSFSVRGDDWPGPPDGIDLGDLTVFLNEDKPWFRLARQGFGPPAGRIAGRVTVVSPKGTHVENLDADWVKANMPAINGGARPMPRVAFPAAKDVIVVDAKPGELVDLAKTATVQRDRRYVFFAEKAGEIRFVARQIVPGGKRKAPTKKPLTVRALRADGTWGAAVSLPMPAAESQEITFKTPKRGFYVLTVPGKTRTRFLMEKSSAPVAIAVDEGGARIVPAKRAQSVSLWAFAPKDRSFQAILGGSDTDRFACTVTDPTGKIGFRDEMVDDRQIVNLDGAGAAGLWRLDFAKAKGAQFEFVDVDVSGIQGALFLSTEKYWK